MQGIYYIYNKTTGEDYVGQSTDIDTRFRQHLFKLKNGIHSEKWMKNFTKLEDYVLIKVEESNCRQDLNDKEEYYIRHLSPTLNSQKHYSDNLIIEIYKNIVENPSIDVKLLSKKYNVPTYSINQWKSLARKKSLLYKTFGKDIVDKIKTGGEDPAIKVFRYIMNNPTISYAEIAKTFNIEKRTVEGWARETRRQDVFIKVFGQAKVDEVISRPPPRYYKSVKAMKYIINNKPRDVTSISETFGITRKRINSWFDSSKTGKSMFIKYIGKEQMQKIYDFYSKNK